MWKEFVNRLHSAALILWIISTITLISIFPTGGGYSSGLAVMLIPPFILINLIAWILHAFD